MTTQTVETSYTQRGRYRLQTMSLHLWRFRDCLESHESCFLSIRPLGARSRDRIIQLDGEQLQHAFGKACVEAMSDILLIAVPSRYLEPARAAPVPFFRRYQARRTAQQPHRRPPQTVQQRVLSARLPFVQSQERR